MKCPQCQFESPPGFKFCGQCGTKLSPVCAHCGTENPPGFKFCGGCGQPLGATASAPAPPPAPAPPAAVEPPASPAPAVLRPFATPARQSYTPPHLSEQVLQSRLALEGERKQVTVLFCDLVGSTALAERLGPEVMHLLLNRFFELALGEVHRYEGTINQFLGDGLMALFGAPIAHEDHARRAVLAALGLQKAIRDQRADLGERYGIELKVRMGLNTGWVVVGGIGDHLRTDYTAVGDTTNLAARLQQIAEPGSVLVSETTWRMVQGEVQAEALSPTQVKGKAAPVQAFRVLGLAASQAEQTILGTGLRTPFVGRERELAVLDELREQAESGQGQIVGIAGEAGSGKSRLLYEIRHRAWSAPAAWLTGRCLSYGTGSPFLPLRHMLRNEWGINEGDGPGAVAAKIREGLTGTDLDPQEALPYLLRLLDVQTGTEALAELSPQALQARTFAILRQTLFRAGRGGLVLLEIEDLHWIDQTSEDFLAYLIEGLPVVPVLLVLTYRSGYQPRWMDKSYATQIALRRLTARDSRIVVDSVLRRSQLPEGLAQTILDKAEGNPFFLEELTRSLLERQSQGDVSVPDTIHGVLIARIDRLPEEHKRLLQTSSVLGREFGLDLLEAIWDQSASLPPLLTDLKRWEFLYEAPENTPADRPACFFKHALTQEAVYQSLLIGRRQALHGATVRALEDLYADRLQDVYDRLAYHAPRADEPEKAVDYLSLFAEKAAQSYAHAEAAKALAEALELAPRLPEERRDRRTLELVLQLAGSLLPLARFPEKLELLLRHGERVERLADPSVAGRYHFWLAHTYSYLGNQEEAARCARLAIAEARRCGDEATEGKACYVLTRDAFWAGQFARGIEDGLRAVELLDRSGERWWAGQAHWVAGFHHFLLGQFDAALESMERAHEIWKALADPRLDPSWSTGYFYASLGDWERGIAECQGGLARAQDPLNTSAGLGFLGYAYLEKGDFPRAVETLEDSVGRLRGTGMQQLLGWFSAYLGEAYLGLYRFEEARTAALEAVEATQEVKFWYGIGLAQRAVGRIAAAKGGQDDLDEAAERLGKALDGFLELEVPFEVARTRLDLAALAEARGLKQEGFEQLRQARAAFLALKVPRYAEQAQALAARLGIAFVA
ncbi:MAG TPA: adenylate/guanylate cyclase domain-containing protein [Thermoanaerobaculia bacterium]|nr:adenylate/guanylate cyclase domain-containing protein [Thermoanaerobaculia bacterium]